MTLKQLTLKGGRVSGGWLRAFGGWLWAFGGWLWALARRLWVATGFAREVLFAQKTFLRWLLKAHKAQIVLGLSLILGIFAIEPVAVFVGDFVHPPKWQKWKKKVVIWENCFP